MTDKPTNSKQFEKEKEKQSKDVEVATHDINEEMDNERSKSEIVMKILGQNGYSLSDVVHIKNEYFLLAGNEIDEDKDKKNDE